jgi:hypothetical protein
MIRTIFTTAVVAVLCALATGAVAPAKAAQSDDCFANFPTDPQQPAYACNQKVEASVEDVLSDELCTPEPILFSGTIRGHNHITSKAADNNIFLIQEINAVISFRGIGTVTGNRYVWNATANDTFTQRLSNGADITSIEENLHVTTPGPNNNLVLHLVFHQTIDATGRYHPAVDNARIDCQ